MQSSNPSCRRTARKTQARFRAARADAESLPFEGASFDLVLGHAVLHHLPDLPRAFTEFHRVLRPGGILVIGTPDYATIGWRLIEPLYGFLMPGGYRDEHITHYTRQSLTDILDEHGFAHEETAYVARSELIMRMRKKESQRAGASTQARFASESAA